MADIYNPSDGTSSNKPYSLRGKPSVGRRYYYDKTGGTFRWRQFLSIEEACLSLPLEDDRRGHEPLVINTGGTLLPNGYIEGGNNQEYWWKDGYENENLVLKIPNNLPVGNVGDIIRVITEGTNTFDTRPSLRIGAFVDNDIDLANALNTFVSQQDVFNTFGRFAHGYTTSDLPDSLTLSNIIPGYPPHTNSWSYDSINDLFSSTYNTGPAIGLVSKVKLKKYRHKATVGASAVDNDRVGLVIAFFEDINDLVPNAAFGLDPADYNWDIDTTSPTIPNQHTLSVVRNRDNISLKYYVIYNFGKVDQTVISDNSSAVWTDPAFSNWFVSPTSREVDIEVVRDGDIITVRTSEMSDSPTGKGSLRFPIEIDLNSNSLLSKFKGSCSYGYMAQSQALSFYKDIEINDGLNEIYDLRDGSVWIADSTGNYFIDSDRNIFNEFLVGERLYNKTTDKFFDILQDNTYIVERGIPSNLSNYYNKEEVDNAIGNSITRQSAQYTTTTGSFTQSIPELANKFVLYIVRSGSIIYRVGSTPSETNKIVSVNSAGLVTSEIAFYDGEFIWGVYQNVTGSSVQDDILIVDTYDQMLSAAIGSKVKTIFVNQASAYNDAGGKDFFTYFPGKGEAYLGIDFNYKI